MQTEMIAVSIPIIFILVTGLTIITAVYLKSRERQMLIEKGLSAEDIKKFFEQKKDPFTMLKIGIIAIAFGLGLGFGLMMEDKLGRDYYVPFSLFVVTGIGFVIANIIGNKLAKKEKQVL